VVVDVLLERLWRMERDSFGLPIKKSHSARTSERVTPIRLSQPPRLLSAPVRKAINPFVDPPPPKPRNPFDDEPDPSEMNIVEMFSSNHSYKQLSTHGVADIPQENGQDVDQGDDGEGEEEAGEPNPYRLSQERQSSRHSFRKVILKAERSMFKRGYGEEVVAVDKTDDNAVIRFLLSQRSMSHLILFFKISHVLLVAYGYPGTDGTFFDNYVNFVFDQHPLIGLVCHHKLHPFQTKHRIAIFLCLLGFSFAISVALLNDFYFKEVSLIDYE
jgi:hypothetical protein